MNSVRTRSILAFLFNKKHVVSLLIFIFCFGCSDKVTLPTAKQLAEFENAGPVLPSLDTRNLVKAKLQSQEYRVMPGEVLELTMPSILQAVTKDEYKEGEKFAPYLCRISDSGTITLPLVGELRIAGLTLAQIEEAVIDKYYPEYAVIRPSVFARILEYKLFKVSITGAINNPGIYTLQKDQMSLVNLLMEAGGIIDEGAAVIKITHPENQNTNNQRITSGIYSQRNIITSQQLATKADLTKSTKPETNLNLDGSKIRISFKPSPSSSTKGQIIIKDNEKIIINKQLDINEPRERNSIVNEMLWRVPEISRDDIKLKLEQLADILVFGPNPFKRDQISVRQYDLDSNTDFINKRSTANLEISSQFYNQSSVTSAQEEQNQYQSSDSRTIILPIKGINIPFVDVVLEDGDSIVVERLQTPLFSVIGLVNKPSNFQYPPDVQYNLMQALAFAGGLDRSAEPRYATIYRMNPDGTIKHAIFQVVNVKDRVQLTNAMNTLIKPGDIIAVEQTPRTRTKEFLDRVFRLNIGTYFSLNDAFDD